MFTILSLPYFSIYYLYCISLRFWSTLITMPYYARPQWNQSSGLNFEDCGLAKNLRKSRFEPYAPRAFWIAFKVSTVITSCLQEVQSPL